jgi:tRNA (guanine-N7-)-methyltransferase
MLLLKTASCFLQGFFICITTPVTLINICSLRLFHHYLCTLSMGQKKLIRFAEMKTFPNVLEYPEHMQGRWSDFFYNQHPITLELACGKGEYAVGLGRLHANRNFIGVDVKGNRMWVGAKTALKENLTNVAFMRTQIDRITEYFGKGEVSEIWITFPDPQLRKSKHKKRLTHPKFLRLYQQLLKQDGLIHLKTDSPVLYQFTKKVIELYHLQLHAVFSDLYQQQNLNAELQIKTHYESLDIAKSNRIHYLCFSAGRTALPLEKDALLKQWVFENENE